MNFEVKVFPGGTDSRFYRSAGFPAYGISPFRNTPTLLHDHNEFLNDKVFLEGIEIYAKLIKNIANC
jgi:aminoacylase